jgi:hypothetical protein
MSDPPPWKAVLFCPLPGQVWHLKWWIQQYFGSYVDIFWMYTEMDLQERTDKQLWFQDSRNPSIFITTPKIGSTGLNLTAANHAVITQRFWVLNEQQQAFAQVVQFGQNCVLHTWLLHTGPDSYDDQVSELHQRSEVAKMRVRHGLMNHPDIMIDMIYLTVKACVRHTVWLTQGRGDCNNL